MNYTKKQYDIIKRMVKEFSKVDDKTKRKELIWWYDFASGIGNMETTEQILKDMNAI